MSRAGDNPPDPTASRGAGEVPAEPCATTAADAEPAARAAVVTDLFVYYRVPSAQAAVAAALARDCQQRLRAAYPGLLTRLLRRPDTVDGLQTWMETYRLAGNDGDGSGGGIDVALQAAIEAHAQPLAGCIAGPRHVERFTPCA